MSEKPTFTHSDKTVPAAQGHIAARAYIYGTFASTSQVKVSVFKQLTLLNSFEISKWSGNIGMLSLRQILQFEEAEKQNEGQRNPSVEESKLSWPRGRETFRHAG